MIVQRNALHLKDIGLNAAQKGKKKWFDRNCCEIALKEVLVAAKTLQRYPKGPIVKGKYHKLSQI